VITHEQANEMLAVFALDAVDEAEHGQIEEHLAQCAQCRAELDALRDVAAALGNSVEPLPDGLWSSIADALPPRADEEPPPMPALVPHGADDDGAKERLRAAGPTPGRSSRRRLVSVASLGVAAAALAAVLGVNLMHDNNKITQLQQANGRSAVAAALRAPGHKVVDVESTSNVELARFVVLPSGQGYLVHSSLPPLSSAQTYQLWGLINGHAISLGLLGSAPRSVAFTLAGAPQPSELGITVEPAGGSVLPTRSMIAAGMA
jgi:anti-sigma factor RsiW